jgi:hypothetical protein
LTVVVRKEKCPPLISEERISWSSQWCERWNIRQELAPEKKKLGPRVDDALTGIVSTEPAHRNATENQGIIENEKRLVVPSPSGVGRPAGDHLVDRGGYLELGAPMDEADRRSGGEPSRV